MAKGAQKRAGRAKRPKGPWPVELVAMAAAGRADGGVGLQHLLRNAGFDETPAVTIIVKRPRTLTVHPDTGSRELVDPAVDDVLDALRALCA